LQLRAITLPIAPKRPLYPPRLTKDEAFDFSRCHLDLKCDSSVVVTGPPAGKLRQGVGIIDDCVDLRSLRIGSLGRGQLFAWRQTAG
jgi:hypothetical protein